MIGRPAFVFASVALIATQGVWTQPLRGQNVPEPWRSKLISIELDLQAERWEQAEVAADHLIGEMVPRFGPSSAGAAVVAYALTFQALAEVGLEQFDDALLLGAVASLESRTVFVKLIGPRAAAETERERFRQFVGGLERVE